MRCRAIVLLIGTVIGSVWAWSAPASAEPPFFATCGRVDAVSFPTASAPGSITIGGRAFALTVRDRTPAVPLVGTLGCLNQTVTTSGPILELLGMPSPMCGQVMGVLDPVAGVSPAGIDIVLGPNLRVVLFAAPGLDLPGPRTVFACFETGIDNRGLATAVRTLTASQAPAPAVTTMPSTSTAAGSSPPGLLGGVLALIGALLVLGQRLSGRAGSPSRQVSRH